MQAHRSNPNKHTAWLMAALLAIGATARSADTPTLKDAYKNHFYVGTAINRSVVTGTGFRRSSEQVSQDIALVKEQFNQIVAGERPEVGAHSSAGRTGRLRLRPGRRLCELRPE